MIQIVALTDAGEKLGQRLQKALRDTGIDADFQLKPKPFTQYMQQYFQQQQRLIFIGAIAIAVRTLAPVLKNKYQDPAVIVLDEGGKFVIPLLSGHEGGANALAETVAKLLQAQLVQTTAKPYLNPIYTVGMGCEKYCPSEYLYNVLNECVELADISITELTSINSIDIKADEPALNTLAKSIGLPFYTWDVQSLRTVEGQLSQRSDYVFKTVGVYGVAESAALLAAQQISNDKAELVVNKVKNDKATCAIARAYSA